MPTVEKISGGRVYIRPLDRRFEIGDRTEVNEELAAYLVEERGDFEEVSGNDGDDQEDAPDEDDAEEDVVADDDASGAEDDDGEAETCDHVMDNDEVCGRDLPCRYHGDGAEGE